MVNSRSLLRTFLSRLFSRKNAGSPSGEHLAMQQVNALREKRAVPSLAQIQQLPKILSPQERKAFLGGVLALFLGIILIAIGSVFTFFTTVPKTGGTLTEGMLGYPQLINPLYADANTVDRELTALIYRGLLAYNPTSGAIEPSLADTWSLSEDEKTYTVTLNPHATWQDGEPLTAYDVAFTFGAIQNPAYGSPLFEAYRNITVTQVDDRTLTFALTEPYAAFPELLTVGILPAHLWDEISPANMRLAALNLKPVGSGPYVLAKTSKDAKGLIRSISLEASDSYSGMRPYLNEVVVKFYSNTSDLVQAVQTKRIDTTAALSLTEALSLQDDTALHTTALPLFQYVGAFFNTKKAPLDNLSMRKALTLALNIPEITADATGNLGVPSGFSLPGFSTTTASVQDTQTAISLLDELGWTLGESGKRVKDNAELALTITTAERPELARSAERIADAWRALGITVTVQTLGAAEISTALNEKNYDILIAAEQYGAIADPYPFWHSSGKSAGGLNMSQFSTTETDAAVTTLRTSASAEKRAEAFATLNQAIIDNMPAVFLFQNTLPMVHTVDILGITAQGIPNAATRWSLESSWYKRTGLTWKF